MKVLETLHTILNNHDLWINSFYIVSVILLAFIIYFLRNFFCWYLRINENILLLKKINYQLYRIENGFKAKNKKEHRIDPPKKVSIGPAESDSKANLKEAMR